MHIILTICSANYLAHAKTLGQSLIEHNPDFRFVIGLVDRIPPGFDPSSLRPFELLPVEELGIAALPEMVRKYNLVELNTAVKPFYIERLYRQEPTAEAVIYLDPDIVVYSSLQPLIRKLKDFNLIVTPHSCTFDDSPTNIYYETGMLSTGVYNLGFIATARSETTFSFLKWWQKRLENYCYYKPESGLFVDQLWVTLSPLYFPGVYVEKDPGYNMCYWNHFERCLSQREGRWFVNGKHELVFYHFSSYDPGKPDSVTKRVYSRTASFADRPDLKPIYDDYRSRLLANGYDSMMRFPFLLGRSPDESKHSVIPAVKNNIRAVLRTLPPPCKTVLKRAAQFTLNTLK